MVRGGKVWCRQLFVPWCHQQCDALTLPLKGDAMAVSNATLTL